MARPTVAITPKRRYLSLFCQDIEESRLERIVEWCDRYSPFLSRDGNDGVIVDITGCAHLYGGEGALLLDVQRRLARAGAKTHGAIADSIGAAWALARYGTHKFIVSGVMNTIALLDPLPVEALRLDSATVQKLRRLGLTDIASIRKLARSSLNARFGETLLGRMDQAFSLAEELITPWRPAAEYRASRILAEPISTVSSVEHVLRELLEDVCLRLEKNHLGSRCMDLACYRVDGTVDRCEVRTSKPTRSSTHLIRLFRDRLEKLWADFGFETFTLSVLIAEELNPSQLSFIGNDLDNEESQTSFDAFIDRISMRLGIDIVNRIAVCESYLPEFMVKLQSAVISSSSFKSAEWPLYRLRPTRLINPPMPIEVPDAKLSQYFVIGKQRHTVVRAEGPERLTPEWWREPVSQWETRDYYRVEDDNGLRFWIFQCHKTNRWYLHGHFA